MRKSTEDSVDHFLNTIETNDSGKYVLLSEMREIVFKCFPDTKERMMYGGIMFSHNDEDYAGLFVRKNHISFEFSNGYKMNDPLKQLEGSGKFRRHLKIKEQTDIREKAVKAFVEQAI